MSVPIIKYLRTLAWAWGTRNELFRNGGQLGTNVAILTQWTRSFNEENFPFATTFYARKNTELMEAGYCILEDMADPMTVPEAI